MTSAPHTDSPVRGGPSFDLDLIRAQQEKLRHTAKLHWTHWLIISLSLLITVFAWKTSESALVKRDQIRFDREAERSVNLMKERITNYEDALLSGVAAMQSHGGNMTREEWRRYSKFLQLNKRYPGINGIGVIHHVDKPGLPLFLERIRDTVPDFRIFPAHDYNLSLPITYIEPEATNQSALGLDVAFEKNRRTAALLARLTGETQISGPIILVQDETRTPGFLFYAPYYRGTDLDASEWSAVQRKENFRGLIYAPLILSNLVEGVLHTENSLVRITLLDHDSVLYEDPLPQREEAPAFSVEEKVRMHGRIWTFRIASTVEFELDSATDQPIMVLLSGLCLDAMLFAMFWMMSSSNKQVLLLAEEMTDNLSSQAQQLQENNRDLESFAHIVSHDLKTPIRNIHSLTQILEDDLSDYMASNDQSVHIQSRLDGLRDQATRSQSLITGILEYSVLDGQDAPTTQLDTYALITRIGRQLELNSHQLTLSGNFPTLFTHATRLEQVLTNLMENAIKYNPNKDTATLGVSVIEEHGVHRFRVSDNGPGIARRFHKRIFQPFTTLESITDIHSSGIGLSIVQRAVERQGGQIDVISQENAGTTFEFTWPISDEQSNNHRGKRYA